jgi:hypothetical protein
VCTRISDIEIQYSQLKINHLNDTPSTKAAGGGIFSGVFNKDVKVPLQEAELVGTSSSNTVTHSLQKLEDAFKSIWYKLLSSLFVNRNITKEYRMLHLWFQGLALPNPNMDALSKKIHLLQSHWDTWSMSGQMLHQAYQVFQVKVGLGRNIFSQSFISFGRLATHRFFQNLWELLHRYGVVFHLHHDFDIPLPWEQDRTLIDAVHDTGIFDRR